MKKVAVVGVPGGWSSELLSDALEELTGFRCLVDLSKVSLDFSTGRVFFRDVELTALDGLAVKKVGPAYSPKLLDRLEILRFIERRGIRVFSKPQPIAKALNRLSCTVCLASAQIPMPPTTITEDLDEAAKAVNAYGRAVLKPLYTSKARGMAVLEAGQLVKEELENYQVSGNGILYIQQMIDLPGKDLGLVFLGGRYMATYARVGQKGVWNTTTASGGRYQSFEPDQDLIDLADRAQKVFGLDFTCVDVAESNLGPVVFEVSAFGGFRGLWEGCRVDAARAYAKYIIEELES